MADNGLGESLALGVFLIGRNIPFQLFDFIKGSHCPVVQNVSLGVIHKKVDVFNERTAYRAGIGDAMAVEGGEEGERKGSRRKRGERVNMSVCEPCRYGLNCAQYTHTHTHTHTHRDRTVFVLWLMQFCLGNATFMDTYIHTYIHTYMDIHM